MAVCHHVHLAGRLLFHRRNNVDKGFRVRVLAAYCWIFCRRGAVLYGFWQDPAKVDADRADRPVFAGGAV